MALATQQKNRAAKYLKAGRTEEAVERWRACADFLEECVTKEAPADSAAAAEAAAVLSRRTTRAVGILGLSHIYAS